MNDLLHLKKRIEGASGPNRELDARLSATFDRKGISYGFGDDYGWAPQSVVETWSDEKWAEVGKEVSTYVPRYTASLDAALALVERLLPSFYVTVEGPKRLTWRAELHSDPNHMPVATWGATPALALLSALLTALSSSDQANGEGE